MRESALETIHGGQKIEIKRTLSPDEPESAFALVEMLSKTDKFKLEQDHEVDGLNTKNFSQSLVEKRHSVFHD